MKMQFVPANHGQNTLGTDVPRVTRHDGAKNTAGRVPGTHTGAADLDYEGNVYNEKMVMWETLSPGATNIIAGRLERVSCSFIVDIEPRQILPGDNNSL